MGIWAWRDKKVAPLAGAWIEIGAGADKGSNDQVAPLAGAWIEMTENGSQGKTQRSLPSRERGLKFIVVHSHVCVIRVAPLAGAWIEIF